MMKMPDLQHRLRYALFGAIALGAVSLAGILRPGMMSENTHGFVTGAACGMGVAWLVFQALPRWWREQCEEDNASPAGRRYRREMLPAMGVYMVAVMASSWLLKHGVTSLPLRVAVALLPVLPIGLVIRAFMRYLRGIDEFKRQIELEAIAVGALLTSMVYVTGTFLQMGKLIDVPSGVAMVWVFPLICLGYGIGKFLAMRRYQ